MVVVDRYGVHGHSQWHPRHRDYSNSAAFAILIPHAVDDRYLCELRFECQGCESDDVDRQDVRA